MRTEVDAVLRRCRGVAVRPELLAVVTVGQLDDEVRRGHLVALFPGAYCRPWDAEIQEILDRAALRSVGPPVVLSHLTGIRRWGLPTPVAPIHLSVAAPRHVRPRNGIVVHRVGQTPSMTRLRGLPTVKPAVALVTSWPLLDESRAPLVAGVRDGLVSVAAVRAEVARHPRLAGRAGLRQLVDLLERGCESELEIWGLLSVFDVPGLRHGVRQFSVSAGGRLFRIDLAYVHERVAVEMDGNRWHSTAEQRERDRRRDAALAAAGWVTLRFSWHRLHEDVAGCRRETLATLRARER